jgi:hypothetical protein
MIHQELYIASLGLPVEATAGEGAHLGAKGREKEGGKSGSEATAEVPSVLDSIQKGEFETWKRKEHKK